MGGVGGTTRVGVTVGLGIGVRVGDTRMVGTGVGSPSSSTGSEVDVGVGAADLKQRGQNGPDEVLLGGVGSAAAAVCGAALAVG